MCDTYNIWTYPAKRRGHQNKKNISSKKIAKRTKTQEGKTSRGATFSEKEDIQYLVQDDHSYGP